MASLGLVYHFEPPQSVVQGRPAQGSARVALQGPNGCRAPLARAYGLNATEMGSIPRCEGRPGDGRQGPVSTDAIGTKNDREN
jgi:hypothetical protein